MNFQSYIYGKNHFNLDPDLQNVLKHYWQDYTSNINELVEFGELAGGRAYEIADHVDHSANPILIMHDQDGNRIDRARLSPAHKELLKELASINKPPYEGGSWIHHFALGYLLADPGLYCSIIVTNQTAYAIYKYAPEYHAWLQQLLSGDWLGATWMTETQGGSDLGANTTRANLEADGWRLNGEEKYFASNAGLADLAIVTARPEDATSGAKGIALFLVPRLRSDGELNFTVRRLKSKSATRAVPTGEVEFNDSRAYLIGDAKMGIYYTLENLTVSRLANAVGAMGLARKAHLESLYRTKMRSAFGAPIREHPLIRRDLTDLAVRTAGGLCLVFHAINAFDSVWTQAPPYDSRYHYARYLSHLAKNRTALHADATTRMAIDIFGGLGFLEEYPVYRLHREALVTGIWEGTSNIQALDMLEAMGKKSAHESFLEEFIPLLNRIGTNQARLACNTMEKTLGQLSELEVREAQWYAKDSLDSLADAAQVALLYKLGETSGERYIKLAELYCERFVSGKPYPAWALDDKSIWYPLE